ncbi:GNAT family N-acetyltransferase [Peribacillus cavernae]|uniref:GNAT family N-acetyltransferase n=1 Tax=Peribacillus cavernae TaxID=1674310 RepID=A0A433HRN8_9BACI|nr:GNAT family N-acetyltransferase [Peribacillus cavernae]MDQ0218779.1 ribosomal protein S18 acetylase RimI-like enzyme [Peribacillus cavernae]RUQ30990.1 GNAT family N-acetyltransferase [Peribacillus cavernae]
MKISQTTDYELVARLNKPVHDLHTTLYPKYFTEYNFEDMKEMFKHLVDDDNFIFLVLEDNQNAVGYAWLEIRNYPGHVFKKEYKSVYVNQISITETARKKGFGSKLMEEVYKIAKNKHIDLIELDYWSNNNVAKDFYKKLGFKIYREFVYKEV